MSGSENKEDPTKEKGMSMENENLAYDNKANSIKDSMPANTERATFALG
jgi:hypothetical protein